MARSVYIASKTGHAESVYIASKTGHAEKWIELRKDYNIASTWIDEAQPGQTNDWNSLSRRCIEESTSVDFLVLYREPQEDLKGALVEVGAALAVGVPVRGVGEFGDVTKVITRHPGFKIYPTLELALSPAKFQAWEDH